MKISLQACTFEALSSSAANMNSSTLVSFPAELLHAIFAYITISDSSSVLSIMILRATCQRFRCFFDDPLATVEPATQSVMRQRYSCFLRSRRLYRLIRSETTDQLVCIVCMRLLPLKFFFSTAIELPPQKRCCKGHEGELVFFDLGYSMRTWEDLHVAGLQYWHPIRDYWWPNVSPTPHDGARENNGTLLRDGRIELGPGHRAQRGVFFGSLKAHDHYYGQIKGKGLSIEAGDYLLRREWLLQSCEAPPIRNDQRVTTVGSILDSVLSRVTYRNRVEYTSLCPHMDGIAVASASTVRRLLRLKTIECSNKACKTRLWIERQTTVSCTDSQGRSGLTTESGAHPDKVYQHSYQETAKEWLVLVVVRNVGSMTEPTDPKWIAQLSAPRWLRRTNYCPPLWLTSMHG